MLGIDLDFVGYRGVALHPYPATMPYPLAETLLLRHSRSGDRVFDPFAGSGTTLRAALAHGRAAVGCDLNPLALLIARVSISPFTGFSPELFHQLRQQTWTRLGEPDQSACRPADAGERIERWFSESAIDQLSRLASALAELEDTPERDALLVAFSRTARRASRARPGELKLWRRAENAPSVDALALFFEESLRVASILEGVAPEGSFGSRANEAILRFGDAKDVSLDLSDVGLVLTSPPYGDAWTTVAYGNFTMLSRLWLGCIDPVYVARDPSHEDELLPGGRLRESIRDVAVAFARSPLLSVTYEAVLKESPDRAQTMAYFFADMVEVYDQIARTLRSDGSLVNVVGPRKVSGVHVDTGAIITELLQSVGLEHQERLTRRVSGKRLPSRTKQRANHVDDTINHETIDVLRPS